MLSDDDPGDSDGEMETLAGTRLHAPALRVRYTAMRGAGNAESSLRACIGCSSGVVPLYRDGSRGYEPRGSAHCLLCGQRYAWTDIEELRAGDWAKPKSED